jgi:hypothetical protein
MQSIWSEQWRPMEARLTELKALLEQSGSVLVSGGDFDAWDISIRGGLFGSVRVLGMVEEHGNGRQLYRFRSWPKAPAAALACVALFTVLGLLAALAGATFATVCLALADAGIGYVICSDYALGFKRWRDALAEYVHRTPSTQFLSAPADQIKSRSTTRS